MYVCVRCSKDAPDERAGGDQCTSILYVLSQRKPVPLVPSRFTSLGHLHYCTLAYLKVGKVIRTFTKGS